MLTRNSISVYFFLTVLFCGCVLDGRGQVPKVSNLRVETLELDRTTITVGCRGGQVATGGSCTDSPRTIRVKTTVSGSAAPGSHLETIVSGGRTVRINANEFDWQLQDLSPGTYTITINAITKGGEYGAAKTATVIVGECKCGYIDECRKVTVIGPSDLVTAGEKVQFTAHVTGQQNATYNWNVSTGVIANGQGTPTIVVDTEPAMAGQSLTATVDVPDLGGMQCGSTASETVTFISTPTAKLVEEFSTTRTTCEDVFARMDHFYNELNNDPSASGVIIVYIDASSRSSGARKEKQIRNHIKMRNFDPTRVTLTNGSILKDAKTEFWIVPAGGAVPEVKEGIPLPNAAKVTSQPITPYQYAAEYSDGIPGCSGDLYDIAAYAKVLNSPPKSRGRIVISESSPTRFSRKKAEIFAGLKKNGVSAGRLTAIFKKVRPMRALESVELWIVPKVQ